jgi:hypothetical protein
VEAFEEWLATSPLASVLKIATGAALGALMSWAATAEIHPLAVAIIAAVVPVVVNWLNPHDYRYGAGSAIGAPFEPFDVWDEEGDR